MCRIVIYGCSAVVKEIVTNNGETCVSCCAASVETPENKTSDAEIVITHSQLPLFHKITFIQSPKEEDCRDEPDEPRDELPIDQLVKSECDDDEPWEDVFEGFEDFIAVPMDDPIHSDSINKPPQEANDPLKKPNSIPRLPTYKKYECEECGKKMSSERSLARHEKDHLQRKYKCTLCPYVYKRKEKLERHMETHGAGRFPCTYCSRIFKSQSCLDIHTRMHTGEKPFECHNCGCRFVAKSHLKVHITKHMHVDSRTCKLCGKILASIESLKQHTLLHNNPKFVCPVCEKVFRALSSMKRHVQSHTKLERNFICSICGKGYVRKDLLRCHMTTHTGEWNHLCSICGKAFRRSNAVMAHMKIHLRDNNGAPQKPTGRWKAIREAKFECHVCKKSFTTKGSRDRHLLQHTKKIKDCPCPICGKAFFPQGSG